MKKTVIFIALLFFTFNLAVYAQLKIGYIDSDAIMKQLPDAQDAQKKLDDQILEWRDELKKMKAEWKKKYDDYEKRKLTMSPQRRDETEKELMKLEDAISDYRQKKFGANGELFKKEGELMKPVQNRIFSAIQEIAKEEDLDFVFDRSGDILFLYAKEEYDITNLVLDKLK
jgi:outer membrane protein